MTLLEMREAGYAAGGICIVPPVTLVLEEQGRLAVACEDERAASALAMMACGILKANTGSVYVGAFDTRIQPVQVKRLAGFVPHEAVAPGFPTFERYIEYRADLWGLQRAQAVVRARALRERLRGVHEAFAYPLIGALLAAPNCLFWTARKPCTRTALQP